MPARGSIIRTVLVSVVYALIEAYYVNLAYGGGVVSPYHALVFLVGLIAGSDRNVKVWVANVLLYFVLEDDLYWAFTSQLPSQWDPMYVVIGQGHFPIYYVPFLSVAMVLYVKGLREEENAQEAD